MYLQWTGLAYQKGSCVHTKERFLIKTYFFLWINCSQEKIPASYHTFENKHGGPSVWILHDFHLKHLLQQKGDKIHFWPWPSPRVPKSYFILRVQTFTMFCNKLQSRFIMVHNDFKRFQNIFFAWFQHFCNKYQIR